MSRRDLNPVITVNGGHRLDCCWDTCERPARKLHTLVVQTEPKKYVNYVFCCDGHRDYWRTAYCNPEQYGQHSAGARSPLGLWIPR